MGRNVKNENLKLITDIVTYRMVETGLRGGVNYIANRYSKLNNKYLSDYDKNKDSSYLMYLDSNNLYGWAMSQPLPTGRFKWLKEDKWDEIFKNKEGIGYFIECDLEYQLFLLKIHVLHIRNLSLYKDLGMKLTKIHRVLQLNESPWLAKYIDFNTNKKSNAKNAFEKEFFKLMNNAVFEKTLENLRKRINLKLTCKEDIFIKHTSRSNFISGKVFNDDLLH